jgi:cyclopropane-fatty-acyl-phospholipid synthase
MHESVTAQRTDVLQKLFEGYEGPVFSIRLWDGWCWVSSQREKPVCGIVFNSAGGLQSLFVRPSEITLGEAFLSKDIDVEGDLFSVFDVAEHIFHGPRGQRRRVAEVAAGVLLGLGQWWKEGRLHSQRRDSQAISYHYDQPVEFFRPWLGETLAYSCAYFRSTDETIDAAQHNKLELICKKLRLRKNERLLDIGCGWGSLIVYAARNHAVFAEGITISREQATVTGERIVSERLGERCRVDLLDYRQAPTCLPTFDKLVSVGMYEHVGLANLGRYFGAARHMLRPGGVFLNHGIARSRVSGADNRSFLDGILVPFLRDVLKLRRPRNSSFIDKYVFPDGDLVTISQTLLAAESAGFEVRDVENLREHYELTLRRWVDGLRANAATLLKSVPEFTYRIWLLYMAGSAAAFKRGDIGVYQTLLSRPDQGKSGLPLNRDDWYASELTDRKECRAPSRVSVTTMNGSC